MTSRIALLIPVALAIYAQEAPRPQGVNFYSEANEAALGEQLAKQERAKTTSLPSDMVQTYVTQIGARLVAQLPDNVWKYSFDVITDDPGNVAHEPLALPGGCIFVSAQLILAAHSEAELAGMLAHAIAHVAARHGTRMATRSEIAKMASVPIIYMSPPDGAVPASLAKMQAKFELEADRVGAGIMAKAGYDPVALLAYTGRDQGPDREERVENLKQAIAALPEVRYSEPDGLAPIQQEVRRLMAPLPAPSLR